MPSDLSASGNGVPSISEAEKKALIQSVIPWNLHGNVMDIPRIVGLIYSDPAVAVECIIEEMISEMNRMQGMMRLVTLPKSTCEFVLDLLKTSSIEELKRRVGCALVELRELEDTFEEMMEIREDTLEGPKPVNSKLVKQLCSIGMKYGAMLSAARALVHYFNFVARKAALEHHEGPERVRGLTTAAALEILLDMGEPAEETSSVVYSEWLWTLTKAVEQKCSATIGENSYPFESYFHLPDGMKLDDVLARHSDRCWRYRLSEMFAPLLTDFEIERPTLTQRFLSGVAIPAVKCYVSGSKPGQNSTYGDQETAKPFERSSSIPINSSKKKPGKACVAPKPSNGAENGNTPSAKKGPKKSLLIELGIDVRADDPKEFIDHLTAKSSELVHLANALPCDELDFGLQNSIRILMKALKTVPKFVIFVGRVLLRIKKVDQSIVESVKVDFLRRWSDVEVMVKKLVTTWKNGNLDLHDFDVLWGGLSEIPSFYILIRGCVLQSFSQRSKTEPSVKRAESRVRWILRAEDDRCDFTEKVAHVFGVVLNWWGD